MDDTGRMGLNCTNIMCKVFSYLAAGLFLLTSLAWAEIIHASTEIRVKLFGQPCLLRGPVDAKALQTIHILSPEQLYPEHGETLSSESTRKALVRLRAVTGAPSGLDRYRERLSRRFEAQIGMIEALENARKTHKTTAIQAAVKKHVPEKREKEIEPLIKKLTGPSARDTEELIFEKYNSFIEQDPEEEFHRAIQKMKVQYVCSFEESGGGEEPAPTGSGADQK